MKEWVPPSNHVSESSISVFLDWLVKHGSKFPKLKWPAVDQELGRSAVAIDDIDSEEVMLQIPRKLMMCEPDALSDPTIGPALSLSGDLVEGEVLLTVFVMFEILKGPDSFYFPYLDILPTPDNIGEWNNADLVLVQDEDMILRAKRRLIEVEQVYVKCILGLCNRHPDVFPASLYTLHLYKFCRYVVYSRAFGRRLQWCALVPFADCLNHGNVQTKYDFDVDNNKMFRLFPTGVNRYAKGCQVFNSYGRRRNDNLLLDYGFAILDNEWEYVDVSIDFPLNCGQGDDIYYRKCRILSYLGHSNRFRTRIKLSDFPLDAIMHMRIICMEEKEVRRVEEEIEAEELKALRIRDSSDDPITGNSEAPIIESFQGLSVGVTSAIGTTKESDRIDLISTIWAKGFFQLARRAAEQSTEIKAVLAFKAKLQDLVDKRGAPGNSTVAEDQALLQKLGRHGREDSGDKEENEGQCDASRQVSAVTYRLTRKRIVDVTLVRLSILERFLLSINAPESYCDGMGKGSDQMGDAIENLMVSLRDATPVAPPREFFNRSLLRDYLETVLDKKLH